MWASLIAGLFQGGSGKEGTESVLQLTRAQQIADETAARQRLIVYAGGGVLAALAVGGVLYYVLRSK